MPLEDLARFGCSEAISAPRRRAPGHGVRSPAVKELLRPGAAGARLLPPRRAALPRRDARRLVAAEIMGAIYRGILAGSRRRTTTSSAASSACPARGARSIAATTWAKTVLLPADRPGPTSSSSAAASPG